MRCNMRLLKYGSKLCGETRSADFLRAFKREVETTRIVSFGTCNFHCGYCKRDGQFTDGNGNIVRSVPVSMEEIKKILTPALEKGERIRLSGGDPVMFPIESLEIAKWAFNEYGQKISIAHNGSSLRFIKSIAPYLEYAAIDLKGYSSKELAYRASISETAGEYMLKSTLEVQDFLSRSGVLVDVRTPIFGDTPLDGVFKMAEMITADGDSSKEFWTLRAYKKVRGCDWLEPSQNTMYEWAKMVSLEFPQLPIGLRLKWEGQKEFKILRDWAHDNFSEK